MVRINFKIIFRPICWITEIYYQFRYNQVISGHSYIEQEDKSLLCDICGHISK
jgi:hypothetical protein